MKFPLISLKCVKKSGTLLFKINPPLHCFENFLSPKIKPKFGDSIPLKKRENKLCNKYVFCIYRYMRMSPESFQYILNVVGPKILKEIPA